MRINPYVYGIFVLILFFGVILGFQAAGIWSVSGKLTTSGEQVQPSAADVNTIKGWMTLEQITTTFNVPLPDLLTEFDLPSDTPPTTAIKDLESDLFSVTNLRTWLKSRMNPAALPQTESTPLAIPTQQVTATPTPDVPTQPSATPAPTEHAALPKTVTGKTTFQELLDWGVSKETVQKIIGADLPATSTLIKDYVTGKGLAFPTIKTLLQAEVDKIR
jgi:hypothetical protein